MTLPVVTNCHYTNALDCPVDFRVRRSVQIDKQTSLYLTWLTSELRVVSY